MSRFPLVMLIAFALTLFTSATLLFLVQPMIGKMILPLLGGTPEVWNTCMVFFQAMLLAGYAYAHATTRWLGVRRQAAVHLAVLVLPLLLFAVAGPIAVNKGLIVGGGNPAAGALLVLLCAVGLPFFVVSTTSPLLQQWFSSTDHPSARDPYFLSTASNSGSMLALVGYPVLVEPFLPLRNQAFNWAIGYGLYILLTGTCAVLLWKSGQAKLESAPASDPAMAAGEARSIKSSPGRPPGKGRFRKGDRPEQIVEQPAAKQPEAGETALIGAVTLGRRLRWILLAFVPSSLLMGVTTYITTDIAAIPLLWVPPLALYLLSFMLVFAKIPRSVHQAMILSMPLLVLLLVFTMLSDIKLPIGYNIGLHLLLMFVVAMVCHGEMVRDRPPTKFLTEFYIWMSVGGVLGGIFNALIAPVIFNSLAEYRLAMVLACILLPPLVPGEETEEPSKWGRYADLFLLGLFAVVGAVLFLLRVQDGNIPFGRLRSGGWGWLLTAVLAPLAGGAYYVWRSRVKRSERTLDIALPLGLLLLTVGLVWGLDAEALTYRIKGLAIHLPITDKQFRVILTFGLPAVLCYTFVERSLRFGLGVGAILLTGAFSSLFVENTIYEHRSYYGVLRVELKEDTAFVGGSDFVEKFLSHRLVHDTTPDGHQFLIHQYELPQLLAAGVGTTIGQDGLSGAFNFVAVLKAYDHSRIDKLLSHRLVHGTTLHGKQYLIHQYELPQMLAAGVGTTVGQDGLSGAFTFVSVLQAYDYSHQALTYYHRTGPIGPVMQTFNRFAADRMGVIGLGTGSLAAYGRTGQDVVFYDIDQAVADISYNRRDYFSFIQDAKARGVQVSLVLGDARLEIERYLDKHPTPPEQDKYSVLAVDAFSSDAIPIHLITREAVQLFMRMVREKGVLTYHVSNRYLELAPVLANIAKAEGLVAYIQSGEEGSQLDRETIGKSEATWVVLARQDSYLDDLMTDRERTALRDTFARLAAAPLDPIARRICGR